VERPKHIGALETLGIFGIHADYMAQFRDFLEEEGLPTNDDRGEFLLPSSRTSARKSSRRSGSRRRSTASAPSSATPSASSGRSRP
jgi:hypothetical protein